MNHYEAVTLYAGLFIVLFVILKLNAGRVRFGSKINVGDDGNEAMLKAMRMQGNAVEDVPIVLLGLFGLALLAAPIALIHGLGSVLLISRILHAVGLGGVPGLGFGRVLGTVGSMLTMWVTAGSCIWFALA